MAKVVTFIYIIDDIYDVVGSLDELPLFTEAINKWEHPSNNSLPDYMRMCYAALHDTTNEIANIITKEHGWNPINSLKRVWAALCNSFMVEAKWFPAKHIPTTDDYLKNGVISTGARVIGVLWDDLGSAKDENQEGFDGSYIECYMKEHPQCFVDDARAHVMDLISKTWETLNKECFCSRSFSPYFIVSTFNCARMVKVMYSYDEQKKLPLLEEYKNTFLFGRN
ncbi:(3S,6E)-nerolidol synthase 1-like [Typha latifolia]|uniref:(3S,6E)-nerolidol synthase 1-like n=1 Tax=Typha latifolia TaxID=4733 RepID=UPI003C308681